MHNTVHLTGYANTLLEKVTYDKVHFHKSCIHTHIPRILNAVNGLHRNLRFTSLNSEALDSNAAFEIYGSTATTNKSSAM